MMSALNVIEVLPGEKLILQGIHLATSVEVNAATSGHVFSAVVA